MRGIPPTHGKNPTLILLELEIKLSTPRLSHIKKNPQLPG